MTTPTGRVFLILASYLDRDHPKEDGKLMVSFELPPGLEIKQGSTPGVWRAIINKEMRPLYFCEETVKEEPSAPREPTEEELWEQMEEAWKKENPGKNLDDIVKKHTVPDSREVNVTFKPASKDPQIEDLFRINDQAKGEISFKEDPDYLSGIALSQLCAWKSRGLLQDKNLRVEIAWRVHTKDEGSRGGALSSVWHRFVHDEPDLLESDPGNTAAPIVIKNVLLPDDIEIDAPQVRQTIDAMDIATKAVLAFQPSKKPSPSGG